jgi:hypothetical protein
MSSTFRWWTHLLVLGGLGLCPTPAFGAALDWLEYRAALGGLHGVQSSTCLSAYNWQNLAKVPALEQL